MMIFSNLTQILTGVTVVFPLQVHSLQRKALQMSGVWEGLLSVQDSGCPQNITHAGQGTEASQDQVIHSASREGMGTLEKPKPKPTTAKDQPKTFFSFFISAVGG